jgi:DNA-directed RNA polymerase subunit N (RpoN/RPB10)
VSVLVALVAATITGAVVHHWDRRTAAQADQRHYERTRVEATPVRDIVEDADHWERYAHRLEGFLHHRDGVIQALLDDLGIWRATVRTILQWGTTSPPRPAWEHPDPNPMPTIRLWRTW